jgi:uncharacterized membrane protein YhaH (DUF805 family)
MQWYLKVIKQYADFNGRARRCEYWFYILFYLIIAVALSVIDSFVTGGALSVIYALGLLIPSLAVGIRRLHDIDRTGWWLLIAFVPLVGTIVLLIFACTDGTAGDNRFGPSPKAA